MAQTTSGEAVPFCGDDEHHDCCCICVVDQIEAAPLKPAEARRAMARERFYTCPHQEITAVEILLDSLSHDCLEDE